MENLINEFFLNKNPVILGISRSKNSWGNTLFQLFLDKGFFPIPVGKNTNSILGYTCKRDLNEIPENSLNVIFSIPSKETENIFANIEKRKINIAWLSAGSYTKKIIQIAKEKEIKVIYGYCPLMFLNGKGVHKFHYWLKKLFNS